MLYNPNPMFPKRLTTSAQVHPRILPYIHGSRPLVRGPPLRRLPLYVAVACLGYAAAKYNSRPPAEHRLSEDRAALLDAYGRRESLEDLEAANQVYTSMTTNRK